MNKVLSRIAGVEGILSRREALLRDENARSLKSGEGRLAILVSDTPIEAHPLSPGRQISMFERHAERYAELNRDSHQEVLVVRNAGAAAITEHLLDPETTDIATFGHGSIGAVAIQVGIAYTTKRVSTTATHLKQGNWLQATCGTFRSRYEIPLGLPALLRPSGLIAAKGKSIDLTRPETGLLKPVFADEGDLRVQIAKLNARYHEPVFEAILGAASLHNHL